MAYADLNTIHNPSTGTAPPATWGDQVRDNFEFFNTLLVNGQGAWTAFTPTITQTISVGKSVSYGRVWKAGRFVAAQGVFGITSSGTANSVISISLPYTAVSTLMPIGQIFWLAGGVYYPVQAVLSTSTTIVGILPQTGLNLGQTLAGWANQLVSGQTLSYAVVYESTT